MNSRSLVTLLSAVCAGGALFAGLPEDRGLSKPVDPPPIMQTPEPASPTVTPLPPPPVPPPDAAGISATTPPIGVVSPQPRPTIPNTLWLSSTNSSTVSIAMHGGRPYVPVVVDGVRRDFLLSSLRTTETDTDLPVDGQAGSYFFRTLQIGDVRLINVKVSRERILPFAQTYLGSPATGILGTELFALFPVTMDYPDRTLTIYRTEAAAASSRPAGSTAVQIEMIDGLPTISCDIDGSNATPCFLDVYSDADLALWAAEWTHENEPAMRMREAELNGEMRGEVVRARGLTIGDLTVAGPLVDFWGQDEYDVEPTARAILGSGVFSRFSVTIDELAGLFVLSDNASAASQWSPFDGSGLWLVWRSGTAMVRSVVPRSPADVAGLSGGDVILAIDGKPLQSLDDARAALVQRSGTKLSMTYQHGSIRRDVMMTLRTLI